MKSSNLIFKQVLFLGAFFLVLFSLKANAIGKQAENKGAELHCFSAVHLYSAVSLRTYKLTLPCKVNLFLNEDYVLLSVKRLAALDSEGFDLRKTNNKATTTWCGFYHNHYLYTTTGTEPPPIFNGFC